MTQDNPLLNFNPLVSNANSNQTFGIQSSNAKNENNDGLMEKYKDVLVKNYDNFEKQTNILQNKAEQKHNEIQKQNNDDITSQDANILNMYWDEHENTLNNPVNEISKNNVFKNYGIDQNKNFKPQKKNG